MHYKGFYCLLICFVAFVLTTIAQPVEMRIMRGNHIVHRFLQGDPIKVHTVQNRIWKGMITFMHEDSLYINMKAVALKDISLIRSNRPGRKKQRRDLSEVLVMVGALLPLILTAQVESISDFLFYTEDVFIPNVVQPTGKGRVLKKDVEIRGNYRVEVLDRRLGW